MKLLYCHTHSQENVSYDSGERVDYHPTIKPLAYVEQLHFQLQEMIAGHKNFH